MAGSFEVFFSYSTVDHATVTQVAQHLHERGIRVFLDRWYLAAGQPWPQALETTLASCGAVAVFVGAEGLSPWQQRERDLALDRQGREPGFPVIPVLLSRADPALGFLKLNTWVDLSAGAADVAAIEILTSAIRGEQIGPLARQRVEALRAEVCPYRGLRPFREEDEPFFFGRASFTETLAATLARHPFVAVVGASGSGKSSVVRAGLIPRLRRSEGGFVWDVVTLRPTDRPLASLAAALLPSLEPDLSEVDRLAEVNKLAAHLADGSVALRDVVARVLHKQGGTDRLLLFVDQWEELYTLCCPDDETRRTFIVQLLEAAAAGPVRMVLTMRGDFFGRALADRALSDQLQDAVVTIGPMTRDELAEGEADMRDDWRLPVTADALTSKLTADQAQAALGPILNAMGRETSLDGLDALIRAVGKLAPRLITDQALVALARVLATIPDTTILDTTGPDTRDAYRVLGTTALSIEGLVSKLVTDRQQVQATLGPILTAIRSARALNGLWPLLHGLQRLAPHLTNDQAQAALAAVLEHWRNTRSMSVHDFVDLAQTVSVLPIRLSDEQMQFALSRTLEALPRWEIGTSMIQALAGAVEAVAPKLTTAQAESALRAVLHAMFSWLSSGWLGAEYQDLSNETASTLGLPEPRGVLVRQVASGSPASAKIQVGDVILAFNGKKIDEPISLTRLVGSEQPGKEVVVTLWHGGEKKDLQVTLGEKDIGLKGGEVEALIAMANALKALPVPLTAEQAQIVSGGFRKLTRQNTGDTYVLGAMAKVVEVLAPKLDYRAKADMLSVIRSILTAGRGDADVRWVKAYQALLPPSSAEDYDKAKADMLSVVRSILSAVGSGDAAVRWAKAYESLLTPSPPEYYIGSIAEALKYPNAAIKRRSSEYEPQQDPEEYHTLTAREYFQKKMSQRFPNVNEIQSGKLTDLLDWVAKNYPGIDLVRPPMRPDLSYVGSGQ